MEALASWANIAILQNQTLGILVLTFLVGCVGSTAYLAAMKLGFMTGEAVDRILFRLQAKRAQAWFILLGGAVAFVFQLPQGNSLAAVQAFVLGITWPTLVSQYVAGRGVVPQVQAGTSVGNALRLARTSATGSIMLMVRGMPLATLSAEELEAADQSIKVEDLPRVREQLEQ